MAKRTKAEMRDDEDADFLALARKRFDQAQTAQAKQRARELEDLRFYAGDQWPTDILDSRKGQRASGGLPEIPARPSLTINKTRAPIRQVLNEERQADFGIELVPADDFASLEAPPNDDEIELREGLIRRIQRNSIASDARTWAFSRAAIAGQGYYRVNTRYVPGTWDQEISDERIFNQSSVTLDPAHEQPDGSDADWVFIGTDMSWEKYKAEFPNTKETPNRVSAAADNGLFRALGDEAPGWFTSEGKTRSVRVVEYFYTERTTTTLMQPGTDQTRTDTVNVIKWVKMDGTQVLDRTTWPSPFMPVIKVLGEELHPYDTERRCEGMVRPAMDSARGFNYMVSKQVESVGLAPIPPWMMAEGQDEGFTKEYEVANTRALPVLHYRQRDLDGNPAPLPSRVNPDVPIEAISRSVAMFDQAIQATTMVPDPTLGHNDPSLRSGKAVSALVQQSQRGTSNYLDNLARSMRYEADIINSLLYPIYGQRPGRLARIMSGTDNTTETVQIGGDQQPSNGTPAPKVYTLSADAKFNVAIKVTKNYDTRRQEEFAILGELISQQPQLMEFFGDLWLKNMDGPGGKEMTARAKLMLNPNVQQALSGQQPIPPQAQQQMQQLMQQHEQLTAHVNDLTDQIKAKQTEGQTQMAINEQNNQTKIEIAKIQAGATLGVADLKATSQQIIESAKAEIEQLRAVIDASEESRLQREQHLHEAAQQTRDQSHEAVMTGIAHAHDRQAAEHDAQLEQQTLSHEAAVMPAPTPAPPATE